MVKIRHIYSLLFLLLLLPMMGVAQTSLNVVNGDADNQLGSVL